MSAAAGQFNPPRHSATSAATGSKQKSPAARRQARPILRQPSGPGKIACSVVPVGTLWLRTPTFPGRYWPLTQNQTGPTDQTPPPNERKQAPNRGGPHQRTEPAGQNKTRNPTEAGLTEQTEPAGRTKAGSQPPHLFNLSGGPCLNTRHSVVRPVLLHHPDTGRPLKRLVVVCQGTLSRLDKPPPTVTTMKDRGDAEAQTARTSQTANAKTPTTPKDRPPPNPRGLRPFFNLPLSSPKRGIRRQSVDNQQSIHRSHGHSSAPPPDAPPPDAVPALQATT